MGETYYDVLGVSPDATQEEIRAAYRERVLETHPDRNDDPDAADQFDAVTTAEEVLSDGTERARYDRLGHEAYVSMANGFSPAASDSNERGSTGESNSSPGPGTTGGGFEAGTRTTGERRTRSTGSNRRRRESRRSGPSHHARQRARRNRERWWAEWKRTRGFEDERVGETHGPTGESDSDGFETRTGGDSSGGRSTSGPDPGPDDEGSDASFSYAVHDWTEEVESGREHPRLDQSTLVIVACLWLLYPVLVYSSVTPQFPLPVNGVVAACTLVLVGYLLTMPSVATVAFGTWSALVPVGFVALVPHEAFSFAGLAVVAMFWVPFGYALTIRRFARH